MPKYKWKGRRQHFFKVKNDERKHQVKQKLQDLQPDRSFENLKSEISTVALPLDWQVYIDLNSIQLSKLKFDPPQPPAVTKCLSIFADQTRTVTVCGKNLPDSCTVHPKLPPGPATISELMEMLDVLEKATVCAGNPDEDYVALAERRGGTITNVNGLTTAYVDRNGKEPTVRHQNCHLLTATDKCSVCHQYRNTLRALKSKEKASDMHEKEQRTEHSSHTNYRYLTKEESSERLENLQKAKRALTRRNQRLKEKLHKIIDKDGLQLHDDDAAIFGQIFEDADTAIKSSATGQFQQLFWEQQQRYNSLKDKRGMRWHPLMIRFALNLKYLSSSAYKAVGQFLTLPSERTLRDYTHVLKFDVGTSSAIIQRLKEDMDYENCTQTQKKICLLIDEMKVKSRLVFSKTSGRLVGFVDLGSVNEEIEQLASSLEDDNTLPVCELAKHMLVIMVRTVSKPSFSFPVSQYPTNGLKGEKLFPIIWEAIEALELNALHVLSITSDGASANRKFYRLCAEKEACSVPYKVQNPYRSSESIYLFCDVPHLLKTARNCFSNSFSHSKSRRLMKNDKEISWKHIESLYLKETSSTHLGIRLCPKLTRDHIWLNPYSRMRVYLAAQVLSSTVADALTYEDRDETVETRQFIRLMDMFFDCLNVRNPIEGKLRRKGFREPYRSPHDERFSWLRSTFLVYLDGWKKEIDALPGLEPKEKSRMLLSRETQEGLRITIMSFTELAPKLLNDGLEYVLSEVFSQDPLEAYFSRQRHRGGSCDNPTVLDFYQNTASLVQQREVYRDLRTMNVETSSTPLTANECHTPLPKRHRKQA